MNTSQNLSIDKLLPSKIPNNRSNKLTTNITQSEIWKSLNMVPTFNYANTASTSSNVLSVNKQVDKIEIQLNKMDNKINKELGILDNVSHEKLSTRKKGNTIENKVEVDIQDVRLMNRRLDILFRD